MEFFTYFFLSFLSWALFWEWRGVGFSGSSLKRERTERYEVYPFPAKNDILIRTWEYFVCLFYSSTALVRFWSFVCWYDMEMGVFYSGLEFELS